MRKILLALLSMSAYFGFAQTSDDLYRSVQTTYSGSARAQALGGAAGFLKGDLSAIYSNPAAGALFDYGAFSSSFSLGTTGNTATTGDLTNPSRKADASINQAGGLLVFVSEQSDWNKIAIGFTYQQEDTYRGSIKAAGLSDTGMDQYFVQLAEGQLAADVLAFQNEFIEEAYLRVGAESGYAAQQTLLGLYGGMLNLDEGTFFSNASYSSVFQRFESQTKGKRGTYQIHGSASYKNKWLFGASLNIQDINYERFTYIDEQGYSTDSAVKSSLFDNYLFSEGIGVSARFGILWNSSDAFGLGVSYQTPTWFSMSDRTAQRFDTNNRLEDISFINFGVINVYDDYTLKLPSALTVNAKIQITKNSLFLLDYQRQNFGDAQLLPNSDPGFNAQNVSQSKTYSTVEDYRMGFELDLGRYLYRLGYGIKTAPYINSDLGKQNLLGTGIGISYGPSTLDIGLTYQTSNDRVYFFDQLLPNATEIKNRRLSAVVTYTFSL